MANVFLHLLNMSLTAGILVVAVVLLRGAFFKAPRWIHCLLWALVAVRLLCPFVIESELSLMPSAATVPMSVVESTPETPATQPVVDTPAPSTPVVDTPITDTPIIDTPVVDTPIIDTPIIDTPVVDTPVVDTPIVNTPIVNTPTETPSATVVESTPDAQSAANPWQTVLSVASWVWLAGMATMAAYAVATTLRLRRRVGEAAHLRDNLWQCDHLRSPFILGVFRPRIYLPSDLDGVARDSVVAHEQAHLHRRDHWWKPLGFLLLTMYWFNPLMWVAYILLCRDIEAACDERVVRDMNAASRRSYSEALLACSAPRRLVSACPLAFGETSVKSRIKSVLSYKKPTVWIIVAALLVSTVAGVCLLTDPKSDQPAKADDAKVSDTTQPTDPDEGDDEQPAAPKYATFIHNGEPKAMVELELDGNGCTYINSTLSSQTAWEGAYEVEGDTFLLSFPNDSMTIEFEGDFTGLTLRMGQSDTRMSYEQMSYDGKELKNGAVFERQMDNRAVSFEAPLTLSPLKELSDDQRAVLYAYKYRTGANANKDLPIIPITSRNELAAFIGEYLTDGQVNAFNRYDDAFFEDKILAAVYYLYGSSSVTPQIAAVEYSGAELVTLQVDVYSPEVVNQMMGAWFMLAEIPRSEIPYATAFRAVDRHHIPTNNYFATYSHPITVGGTEPAKGWSRLIESATKYRQLVERLTWYGADIMADTAFTALGYFTFDGEKKYYVSSDGKQLYDGEQIADLTAADAEWVRYPFSEGVVMDAATTSVTGMVVEWSKEGGYLVLEVTDGDAKLGERVRAYTTLLLPGSGPAVGYSATLYYDGWYLSEGDYSIIYALDRKWMDADMLGGPDDEPWLDYTVTVKDGDGNPIPGVKISISSENIGDIITTDSKGVAKANLPEGVPTGTIEVPEGYVAASEKFTFVAGSDSLTIVLEKEQPTTAPATTAEVGAVYIAGGLGEWKDEILQEVYGGLTEGSLPVKAFTSYDALDAFLSAYASDNGKIKRADFAAFDAAWFADNALLMTYYVHPTATPNPKVESYVYTEDGAGLTVRLHIYVPLMDGEAVSSWYVFSGIRKSDLDGVKTLTAVVAATIPDEYYVSAIERTEHPETASEKWRRWLPSEEGWELEKLLNKWDETGRWGDSQSVDRAFEFAFAFNLYGHTHYLATDFSALLRDDGALLWLTEEEANLIKRILAIVEQQ